MKFPVCDMIYDIFIYGTKTLRKMIIAWSHDSEVSIPLQCNITNFRSFLQYSSTLVILGCRQIKKLKKATRVGHCDMLYRNSC